MPASPKTHHCNNILRHLLIIVLILDIQNAISEEYHFVRGADISWCTEMEADGMRFYNNTGEETDIFTLMKQIGLNTIRLRVWVNPETGYGAWCDKADVLTKAQRAHNQGLDLLLDFHYSDYFADPGRQSKPSAWEVLNFNELKAAVSNHTTDILQALKQEGIEPIWVQIGNETNSGILWEDGKIDWAKSGEERWQNYITLSNACYDAVKAVLPNTIVIIHHDNAKDDNTWFYQDYKQYGGKFDIIGLSHYPDWEEWREDNTKATNNIRKLHDTLQVPVMIVETGYSNWDEERAMQVIQDLYNKASRETGCCGILYWEPEVYGGWKARYIKDDGTWAEGLTGTYGVKSSSNGAFTAYGQPAPALLVLGNKTTPTIDIYQNPKNEQIYNISGQKVSRDYKGIILTNGEKRMQ